MKDARAERALTDVVAVERMAPGMCKVVTFADAYVVDARGEGCNCPDKQYNLPDDETGETTCKHEQAALLYDTDVPGLEMDDNLGGQTLMADGGQVMADDDHPTEKYKVVDNDNDNVKLADTATEAEEKADTAREFGSDDVEIIPPASESPDAESVEPDVVDETQTVQTVGEAEVDSTALAKNPIQWLEEKNTNFVYRVQGKPSISKQGFRYIQQQFGITTEAEVVETFDDPLGVIVWARAERPNGQYAEAHGEGWRFEGDVEDNEFVRYADSRAKSRAISDLTTAGALAVSELGEQGSTVE